MSRGTKGIIAKPLWGAKPLKEPSKPAFDFARKSDKAATQGEGSLAGSLALLAEVDRSYVGRVERGDNNAAVLTLLKLAKALGTSLSKLMQKARL